VESEKSEEAYDEEEELFSPDEVAENGQIALRSSGRSSCPDVGVEECRSGDGGVTKRDGVLEVARRRIETEEEEIEVRGESNKAREELEADESLRNEESESVDPRRSESDKNNHFVNLNPRPARARTREPLTPFNDVERSLSSEPTPSSFTFCSFPFTLP
jgi:hypothetical protein